VTSQITEELLLYLPVPLILSSPDRTGPVNNLLPNDTSTEGINVIPESSNKPGIYIPDIRTLSLRSKIDPTLATELQPQSSPFKRTLPVLGPAPETF